MLNFILVIDYFESGLIFVLIFPTRNNENDGI